jgi:hypothetical protein
MRPDHRQLAVTARKADEEAGQSAASISSSVTRRVCTVVRLTANIWSGGYKEPMPYVTQAELVEIVPDLRAMASVETSEEVRAALNRLADRYAAMAIECLHPARCVIEQRSGGCGELLVGQHR